jgi:hypothetical protein
VIPEWKRPRLTEFLGPSPNGDGYATPESVLNLRQGVRVNQHTIARAMQARLQALAEHPQADSPEADMVRRWIADAGYDLLQAHQDAAVIDAAAGLGANDDDPGGRERFVTSSEPYAPVRRSKPRGRWWVLPVAFVATAGLSAGVLWLAVSGLPLVAPPTGGGAAAGPGPTAAPTASAPGPAQSATVPLPAEAPVSPTVVATAEARDGAGLLRAMRQAADAALKSPAEGLVALKQANALLEQRWAEQTPGERTATLDALLEAMLRVAADPAAAREAIAPLLERANILANPEQPVRGPELAPLAWSTGVLLRLERERELPRKLTDQIGVALRDLLGAERASSGQAFPLGAVTALRNVPMRLLMPTAPAVDRPPSQLLGDFQQWERLVRAALASDADPQERERLAESVVLDGVQRVLINGPDADADRGVYEVLSWLAASRRWREGDPARQRLLVWLDEPRISSADLHAFTQAIVGRSSAEGVDLTMVLPPAAGFDERSRLRAAYARVWGLDASAGSSPAAWTIQARERLAVSNDDQPPMEVLRRAAWLAAINRAVWLRSGGQVGEAEQVLTAGAAALRDLTLPSNPQAGPLAGRVETESGFAARFVQERNPARQVDLIRELDAGAWTAADAEIITEQALLSGAQPEVRLAAQAAVEKAGAQPTVVHAAIKLLPRVPRSAANAAILEKVAVGAPTVGWQHERWPAAIRSALVERLLELLAARGTLVTIDRLSLEFAYTYTVAAGEKGTLDIPVDQAGTVASDAAERLWRLLRSRASQVAPNALSPLTLEAIDQRLAGRLLAGRSGLDRFAALQASAVEAMGYVVSAENPSRAALVASVINRMGEERRQAAHIFGQLHAAEAAMLRLHIIASGESTTP